MNRLIIFSLLSVVVVFGCMMKGYRVDLKLSNAGTAIDGLRSLLAKEGFVSVGFERYQKVLPGLEKSFFKADYSVYVDVFYSVASNADVILIYIYNNYVGNDPRVKPTLLETASRIEKMIQETIPDAQIVRSEGLSGVPFI